MRLSEEEARRRFATARVVQLATVRGNGEPHLVPVTFAVHGSTVVFAVDHKPKRPGRLQRIANMQQNSAVCLLADEYQEDWEQLWWARADGQAEVWETPVGGTPPEGVRAAAIRLLTAKYPQYAARPPEGPVVEVAVRRWSGWAAAG